MEYLEGQYIYGDDIYMDEYYADEKWAYITGFSDYMISNKGRVWSIKSEKFLKAKTLDRNGHLGVSLYADGRVFYKYIHRLVAEAFIPNPDGYPIVRHLYDYPDQNTEYDLAWGTQKDNVRDAMNNGRTYILTDVDRLIGIRDRMVAVEAIDIRSGNRMCFESQREAARCLHVPQSNIWKVLQGVRYSAGGYRFEVCPNE